MLHIYFKQVALNPFIFRAVRKPLAIVRDRPTSNIMGSGYKSPDGGSHPTCLSIYIRIKLTNYY